MEYNKHALVKIDRPYFLYRQYFANNYEISKL